MVSPLLPLNAKSFSSTLHFTKSMLTKNYWFVLSRNWLTNWLDEWLDFCWLSTLKLNVIFLLFLGSVVVICLQVKLSSCNSNEHGNVASPQTQALFANFSTNVSKLCTPALIQSFAWSPTYGSWRHWWPGDHCSRLLHLGKTKKIWTF